MSRALIFAALICAVHGARVQIQNLDMNAAWQLDLDMIASLEPELKQSPCEFAAKHKTKVFGWTQGSGAFTGMQKTLNDLATACANKEANDHRIAIAAEQIEKNQGLMPGLEATRATRLQELQASEEPVIQDEPSDKECELALSPTRKFKDLWKQFKHKLSKLWYSLKKKIGKASDEKVHDSDWEEWQTAREVMKTLAPFCEAKREQEKKVTSIAGYTSEKERREAKIEEFEADVANAQKEAKETFEAQIKEIKDALGPSHPIQSTVATEDQPAVEPDSTPAPTPAPTVPLKTNLLYEPGDRFNN